MELSDGDDGLLRGIYKGNPRADHMASFHLFLFSPPSFPLSPSPFVVVLSFFIFQALLEIDFMQVCLQCAMLPIVMNTFFT